MSLWSLPTPDPRMGCPTLGIVSGMAEGTCCVHLRVAEEGLTETSCIPAAAGEEQQGEGVAVLSKLALH